MDTFLRIRLTNGDASADRVDEMTRQLRRELLLLDVRDVEPLPTGKAPLGARGAGMADIGALLVSLGQSAASLATVVETVRTWRARCWERPTIRLEIDGDVLEISDASHEQTARAFDLFVGRHSAAGDRP